MELTAAERVANGVDLLDSTPIIPDDWRTLINLDTLTLSTVTDCVLGQLAPHVVNPRTESPFGEYGDLGTYLFGGVEWDRKNDAGEYPDATYGFIGCSSIGHEELTDAWRAELTEALGLVG